MHDRHRHDPANLHRAPDVLPAPLARPPASPAAAPAAVQRHAEGPLPAVAATEPAAADSGSRAPSPSERAFGPAAGAAPVQLYGRPELSPEAMHDAAARGTSGGGGSLPHLEAVQRSFGPDHDLSGVTAHVGGEAASASREMGALAYASGDQVAFRDAPDVRLVAHEAAHVVQQRAGVHLSTGVGQVGDGWEQHADAVADRVAAGQSAADLLAPFAGGAAAAQSSAPVQRYSEEDIGFGGGRVSDTGKSATDVQQNLFATDDLVKQGNAGLASTGQGGSRITLVRTEESLKSGSHTLYRVVPRWTPKADKDGHSGLDATNEKGGKDTEGLASGKDSDVMALWSDCGRSSRAVMGTDQAPYAVYNDDGTEKTTSRSYQPAAFSDVIYQDLLPGFMAKEEHQKYLKSGVHYREEGGNKTHIAPASPDHARTMYWELGSRGRDAFDRVAGINKAARPDIGGGFTMNTEYDMPGFKGGDFVWNFHWAGCIMKDGADDITLENYAVTGDYAKSKGVSNYDFQNREWNYAMYGSAGKKGQTFHEQHLATETHGNRASTFAVRSK